MQVMLDLETLGTRPGCVVTAIGAVAIRKKRIISEFYQVINIEDSLAWEFEIDAETLQWWLRQSPEAQAHLKEPGMQLSNALIAFEAWLPSHETNFTIWGNGSNFDNVILRALYEGLGMEVPWTPFQDRCYRTLKSLRPDVKLNRTGIHHHALHDARSQAGHFIRLQEALTC